jgi:hypothetical protein
MDLRRPFSWIFAIGCLGWPIGGFLFGGVDDPAGGLIILAGSLMVLGALLAEFLLRRRDSRRSS